MFVISTIRSHPFHYLCLNISWLFSTNPVETRSLASQLSPAPFCTDLTQLSQTLCLSEWDFASINLFHLPFNGPCILSIFILMYFQRDATLNNLLFSGKLLDIFRVLSPPIFRSIHNCVYSIWYLLYRYRPLLWKSWNRFECGVETVLICLTKISRAVFQKYINCVMLHFVGNISEGTIYAYDCCTLLSINIYVFYVFWYYSVFCCWYLLSSDNYLDILCRKSISMFMTVYWWQSRTSRLQYKEEGSGKAIFDWRPEWVIKMFTPKLNYNFYK